MGYVIRLEVPIDHLLLDPDGGLPSSYQASTRNLPLGTQLNRPINSLDIKIVLEPYLMGAGVAYRHPKIAYMRRMK